MAVASAGVSCSPTLPEPELTPLSTWTRIQPQERRIRLWNLRRQHRIRGHSPEKTLEWKIFVIFGKSPTDSKKICVENLREQTERTALVPVLPAAASAFSTEMTPVVPLSPEANAIVAAINGAVAQRRDGIQGQMGMLARQMTSLKTEVNELGAQVHRHDQKNE